MANLGFQLSAFGINEILVEVAGYLPPNIQGITLPLLKVHHCLNYQGNILYLPAASHKSAWESFPFSQAHREVTVLTEFTELYLKLQGVVLM